MEKFRFVLCYLLSRKCVDVFGKWEGGRVWERLHVAIKVDWF